MTKKYIATQDWTDNKYVAKETGKGLSTNDYTTDEKTKLAGIEADADVNVIEVVKRNGTALTITDKAVDVTVPTELKDLTGDTTHRTVTDEQISAWNNKQGSLTADTTPTADHGEGYYVTSAGLKTAIDAKQTAALVTSFQATPDDSHYPSEKLVKDQLDTKQDAALVTTFTGATDSNYPSAKLVSDSLGNKVDKVSGKQLSTEDFTTALKTKLDGIEESAEVNVLEAVRDASGTALTITDKAVQLSKAAVGLGNVDNTAVADMAFAGSQITSGTIAAARMPVASASAVGAVQIGSGLSITAAGVLSANTQFKFQIFETLPTASSTYAQTVALILKAVTEEGNVYDEYACVRTSAEGVTPEVWKWERIGDLKGTVVQDASSITVNGTTLQTASASQIGLLSAADWSTFNAKQAALTFDDSPTADSVNPVKSGGIKTELDKKVDKVTGKGLSTEDFTSALKTKLEGIAEGAEVNVQSDWNVTDETSDAYIANKPTLGTAAAKNATTSITSGSADLITSGAVYTADEAITSALNTHVGKTDNPHSVTKAQVGLGNVDNTADADKPVSTATQTALDGKVDGAGFTIGKDTTGIYIEYEE